MKQLKNTTGTSHNDIQRRAALLAGGISLIAMSAMLGMASANASPLPYAQILLDTVPAASSSAGFVTSGSQQQNSAATIAASLNAATGDSTVTGNSANSLPSTANVSGNQLAAYATGNAQSNGVDLATIGSSGTANGIAVLAEQSNTYTNTSDPTITTPSTINSTVTDSNLTNEFTNATSGDALASTDNLIAGQATGNVAVSAVNGVVPVTYDNAAVPGTAMLDEYSGSATGNIVVGSSQTNVGLAAGVGSYATLTDNNIGLLVDSNGDGPGQSLAISASQSGNVISSEFLGNSANNDIDVSLTSGTMTGAPTLNGSLVVANQQYNQAGDISGASAGTGASNSDSSIFTGISNNDDETAPITLEGGATSQDDNVISAAATGNSAVGATSTAPGNEITLGVNLAGVTTAQNNSSDLGEDGGVAVGADLALGNLQNNDGVQVSANSENDNIGTYVQSVTGSSVGVAGNAITSNAADNLASNAINTAANVGINLINGLVALGNAQTGEDSGATASTQFGGIYARASAYNGGSITNATESVANNSLTATANINQATNSISLAASTIDAGPLGAAVAPAEVEGVAFGDSEVGAGVSLNNEQSAEANSDANVGPAYIGAFADASTVSNDSAILTNPTFSAAATGNSAANNINLAGSQGVSGAVALLSNQMRDGNGSYAYGEDNDATVSLLSAGEDNNITGSSGVLSGTSISAEATENYADNTVAVSGGELSDVTNGNAGLSAQSTDGPFNAAEVQADLALDNLQDSLDGPAYAVTGDDTAEVTADADGGAITNSAFTVSGPALNVPTMQSLAIGNEASSTLSAIADTTLSDTAGLVNAQEDYSGAVAYLVGSTVAADVNTDGDAGDVTGSSITVGSGAVDGSNGNILRTLAYDNQASNTLAASAGTIDLVGATDGLQGSVVTLAPPYDTFGAGSGVAAAYGLLNDQAAYGEDVASGEDSAIGAFIGNDTANPVVADISANTAGNALVASAFSNQADNAATIAAGALTADGYYPAANVTNLQTGDTESYAALENDGSEAFTTQVLGDGGVTGSTLGVTGNTALTQAEVNQASNSLVTTGGNITDAAFDPALTGLSVDTGLGDLADANLAFSVQNVQYSDSNVTSQQSGMNALLSVGGAVDLSTLTAAGNTFESTAYGNNATSTLGFGTADSPVNALDTSAGVQNVQTEDGVMNVSLGEPGTPAVPATPGVTIGAVPYSVASGSNQGVISNDGGTLTVTGQPLVFNVSSLSGSALTDFEALFSGGTAGAGTYTLGAGTYTLTDSSAFADGTLYFTSGSPVTEQDTSSFTEPGLAGVAAIPASPSVMISAAGDIANSTLGVTGNAFDATVIANAAVNTANIGATSIAGGSGVAAGTANANVDGTVTTALADYAVSNVQSVSASISASANGEVAINPNNTSVITNSTLNVSDNTLLAEAEGNNADNTLSLTATTMAADGEDSNAPTAALVSNQTGTGSVSASSGSVGDDMTIGQIVTAPGAINGSTLTMDGNSTNVLAVVNSVTNLVSASATNLDTADTGLSDAVAGISTGGAAATADVALNNVQTATGEGNTVTATAVTQVMNADSTSATTGGLVNSAVDISGNSTTADANANIANNTLDLAATDSTANAALTNSQSNDDAVNATGLATVQFALNGGDTIDDAAVSNATIGVTDNSLNTQAIGNQASNALNATTGATYGSELGANGDNGQASATYAVLNAQDNTGAVTATGASGSQYAVALNGGGATTPVEATTINVSYNTMNAAAFGNSATNTVTVAALNAGNATVALQNSQINTGAITSSITGSNIGANVGMPGISGGTVAVGNNSIVSSAIGNVATNVIAH